ncbi:zinc-dependent peptidase [Noviherbaspirillum sp. UKPF54]|uniref:M90 family metallopeptidase n=1 Tax=Noviherbaspirillum sp. UKPF54 TaxID=2601898 RepID=UPI0011B1046A|nr:M90 family metallopeptidase [Noviherbaspirillum sp. UKPF54]QDZ28492.1 zinc-dependent peptidase [Noviherbaspirillum sp. UKPF54]
MQWFRQLFKRDKPEIPEALWQQCQDRLPFLAQLPAPDLARLKTLCETFLDRKTFTGAAGVELTDRIAVLIAAQACLPVLNLTLDLYADMAGIIIYPGSFVIAQSEMDEAGVVHEWREPVSGEAVHAGGAVILSCEDIEDIEAPGYNVVIHEFAHKIDMRDGTANGCPPFLVAYHKDIRAEHWQREFSAAYRDFVARVDALDAQLPEDFDADHPADAAMYDELFAELPLDPYAARHPAEFFAVASEAFFVGPAPLAEDYPEIYRLLTLYYLQDPLHWQNAPCGKETGGKHL